MKFAPVVMLFLIMLALPATSHAEIYGGICKASAASAIDAISKVNGSTGDDLLGIVADLQLVSARGSVETYKSGAYTVQANTGSDDYKTCAIMSVEFHPEP